MCSFNISRRLIIFAFTSALALLAFWWAHSTSGVIAQGPPVCVTPPTGMVSWWPGDGNANDIQGSNHGTLMNGATFATGRVGQAFSLDGVDDYVTVPNDPSLNPNTMTVMAWYRTTSFAGNGNNAIVQKAYIAHSPPYYQYHLGVSGDQYPYAPGAGFGFGVAAGGVFDGVGTPPGFWSPGRWYHLVGTYDGTAIKLYVDGALIGSRAASGAVADYGRPLLIGGFANFVAPASLDFTPGMIDEVALFDRALSASEIQAIYNAGSAGKCKPGANNPPVANCQNVTVSAGASCTANASIDAGSSDPDGDPLTLLQSPPGPYPVGMTNVMLTVTDGKGGSSSCSATVTVVDDTPPAITPPPNFSKPMFPGLCSAPVLLRRPIVSDNCGIASVTNNAPAGNVFPVGTTTVTWTVTDVNGNSNTAQQTVTWTDLEPPAITLTGQQIALWPPNHQYETIHVSQLVAGASDNCGGDLTARVVIARVSSDEPEDAPGGGDGNTLNDIVIAANCKSVQLRAERQGSGNGRVYTITFKVRDAAGNVATATAKVTVPKSQNGNSAIDDGPVYTVNGICP